MEKNWWKEGIVYQIYPRSFYDSNNDGIGDLRGIIQKIDYLEELGVDIIWLNPVYESPNDDNGYDISDYQSIMTEFGTMQDWEELLEKLHSRGMKLIMDLVVNHTSDEHKWFIESRSDKKNPYRDYYIWKPGKSGNPPNNWLSVFGGSAWEYDEKTGEYYLHLFTKKQPDLNWENPDLRKDIYDMMNWWLDKGIDGFRMDVINLLAKEPGLPDLTDGSKDGYRMNLSCITNRPKVHDYLQEMQQKTFSNYNVMTVGECPATTLDQAMLYVEKDRNELNMVIHFEHVSMDYDETGKRWSISPIKLTTFKDIFTKWQLALHNKGWNCLYLMNHDQPRSLSRYGNDAPEFREISGKMLITFMLSLQGTPYIYMGDELGMTNVAFNSIDDYRDIETLNYYHNAIKKGISEEEIFKNIHYRSRDNSRTPFHWDDSKNAGFTKATPWIKLNPNYIEINLEKAKKDPDSIFHYYKKMIRLRKSNPILIYGDYLLLDKDNKDVYAYIRNLNSEKALVVLNFTDKQVAFSLPENIQVKTENLLIANYKVEESNLNSLKLKPYEARIYKL